MKKVGGREPSAQSRKPCASLPQPAEVPWFASVKLPIHETLWFFIGCTGTDWATVDCGMNRRVFNWADRLGACGGDPFIRVTKPRRDRGN